MYLFYLIISLGTLLIIDYIVLFKKEFSAPSFLFAAGMFICSLSLSIYTEEWNINIHAGTFWLIFGGVLSFTLGCLVVQLAKGNLQITSSTLSEKDIIRLTPIIKVKRLKVIFFSIIVLYLIKVYFLMSYYGVDSLAAALVLHTTALKFGDDAMKLPFGLSFFVGLPDICGNIFAYLSAVYSFKKNFRRQRNWIWAIFVLCLVGSLLSSGRTFMLWMIIAFGVSYFICMKHNNIKINVKKIIITLLAIYTFAMSFQQLGYLIGREESEDSGLSVFVEYCGAEIQNLDDFIYSDHVQVKTTHFAEVTLENFWANFKVKSHRDEVLYFNSRNGYGLGNVRTTFHNYYIDFGFWGTFVVCFVIGFFIQSIYSKLKNCNIWQTGRMTVLLYVFISLVPACFMSFFSEYYISRMWALFNYRIWLGYIIICYVIYGTESFKRLNKNGKN